MKKVRNFSRFIDLLMMKKYAQTRGKEERRENERDERGKKRENEKGKK